MSWEGQISLRDFEVEKALDFCVDEIQQEPALGGFVPGHFDCFCLSELGWTLEMNEVIGWLLQWIPWLVPSSTRP